jgi:hypothetical protein
MQQKTISSTKACQTGSWHLKMPEYKSIPGAKCANGHGKVMAIVTIVVHAVHQGWLYPFAFGTSGSC